MKLVLSRKGFDASSGGCANPILPDGRLRSLPIPEVGGLSGVKYTQVYFGDKYPTGAVVEALTKGKVQVNTLAHLDPDIDRNAVPNRHPNWRGVFGQSGAAQGHLSKQNIDKGDLFLFFGWFRQTEDDQAKGLKFAKGSPDLHSLWGWLQIGDIVPVTKNTAREFPEFKDHHHVAFPDRDSGENVIYVATKNLKIGGVTKSLPGYGTFRNFDSRLQLTMEGERKSVWCLPQWFEEKGMTYHTPDKFKGRYAKDQSKVLVQSAHRGQEFVLDLGGDTATAAEWLNQIFSCAK
jgi:hypothetical protein